MTLTTLQGMNVNMSELAKAFTARAPEPATTDTAPAGHKPEAAPEPYPAPQTSARPRRNPKAPAGKSETGAKVDPMQWWGSLTQQFQNIASAAMQDVAAQTLKAQNTPATAASPASEKVKGKAASKKSAPRKTRPSRS